MWSALQISQNSTDHLDRGKSARSIAISFLASPYETGFLTQPLVRISLRFCRSVDACLQPCEFCIPFCNAGTPTTFQALVRFPAPLSRSTTAQFRLLQVGI